MDQATCLHLLIPSFAVQLQHQASSFQTGEAVILVDNRKALESREVPLDLDLSG